MNSKWWADPHYLKLSSGGGPYPIEITQGAFAGSRIESWMDSRNVHRMCLQIKLEDENEKAVPTALV